MYSTGSDDVIDDGAPLHDYDKHDVDVREERKNRREPCSGETAYVLAKRERERILGKGLGTRASGGSRDGGSRRWAPSAGEASTGSG